MAAEVLVQWQAAEEAVRQQEARWPALQELMIHIALTREQLQVGAARISTSAATAAITAWQAAGGAAGDAAEFAAAETAAASAGLLLLLQLWHLLLRAQQAPPS